MTRFAKYTARTLLGATSAALLALSPAIAMAQDGQFDLRTRASPAPSTTPEPQVIGPVDPDTPTVRARPRAAPEIVLPPSAEQPSPASTTAAGPTLPSGAPARTAPGRAASPSIGLPRATASAQARPAGDAAPPAQPAASPSASTATPATPGTYRAGDLGVVSHSSRIGLWLSLAALAMLLLSGGWLAWSRHFRHRSRPLLPPAVVRPRAATPARAHTPALPEPPTVAATGVLHLALQATRMSATLVNTTLSYRLAVTNRGLEALHDVRIAGDMIAAHASRSASEQLGQVGAAFPELHRIAVLAAGESVTLGGDIRLPLVSITPIRNGDAALFVPLARLRGQGKNPAGEPVEGGGTFLVGQEPGLPGQAPSAGKRLQPFRLDLGPRNYSRLGQQLLPAA